MARMSAEARAQAALRQGAMAPKPPRHLAKEAKKVWRELVDSRPVDYFHEGNFYQLEQLCNTIVAYRLIVPSHLADPKDRDIAKRVAELTASTSTLCRNLRLTIQSNLRGDSGKLHERTAPRSNLLAGPLGSVVPLRKA